MVPGYVAVKRDDPLTPVLGLPGVGAELDRCRDALDAVLARRNVRVNTDRLAAESRLVGAWANAAMEGALVEPAALRSGDALDDSPLGRQLRAALALAEMAPEQVALLGSAPAQVLARMQVVVARAARAGEEAEWGRPRSGERAVDALHLGCLPPAADLPARLVGVSEILRDSKVPGLLVAAVVHAELAWLRPFPVGSGMVARALDRTVLAQRGVDPQQTSVPEAGFWALGRPSYVSALRGYGRGGSTGLVGWISHYCRAVALGSDAALR